MSPSSPEAHGDFSVKANLDWGTLDDDIDELIFEIFDSSGDRKDIASPKAPAFDDSANVGSGTVEYKGSSSFLDAGTYTVKVTAKSNGTTKKMETKEFTVVTPPPPPPPRRPRLSQRPSENR